MGMDARGRYLDIKELQLAYNDTFQLAISLFPINQTYGISNHITIVLFMYS